MQLEQPAQNTAAPMAEPLPAHVQAALWHGNELRPPPTSIRASGWAALDAELPGGGWPSMGVTELLVAQPGTLEWRLLTPAIKPIVAGGGEVAGRGTSAAAGDGRPDAGRH